MLLFVPVTKKMSALHEQCAEQLHFQHRLVLSFVNVRLAFVYRKHHEANKNKYNIKTLQDPCNEPNCKNLSPVVLSIILQMKHMLTSSGMQLNPLPTKHVPRQSATSHWFCIWQNYITSEHKQKEY